METFKMCIRNSRKTKQLIDKNNGIQFLSTDLEKQVLFRTGGIGLVG